MGKDYFRFTRTDTKGIMSLCYSSKDSAINSDCSKSGQGSYCAEKIRRVSWKIEDDYQW